MSSPWKTIPEAENKLSKNLVQINKYLYHNFKVTKNRKKNRIPQTSLLTTVSQSVVIKPTLNFFTSLILAWYLLLVNLINNIPFSTTGLKKVMWPIYMGLQVLKSVLFAMFLPTIISSVSRLIGKGKYIGLRHLNKFKHLYYFGLGITSGSAGSVPLFIRPIEPPQELDFRDNSMNFDDDSKFSLADEGKTPAGYEYNAGGPSEIEDVV